MDWYVLNIEVAILFVKIFFVNILKDAYGDKYIAKFIFGWY